MKKYLFLVIILIPTFIRMVRPGIYSMQDFPYFRVIEYHHCLVDSQFPCRWASSAGLGLGEPVFNFYSHIPFFTGAALMNLGVGGLDSLKFLFSISLVLSGLGMFLLSKKIWKNDYSAFISAVLYVYAPYRAVNVWVRGALPESFAFIFIPFILLTFENYKDTKKTSSLLYFSLLVSGLILTHNLSVLLFAPAIVSFIIFRLLTFGERRLFFSLLAAGLFSLLLCAFYLLPTIIEAPLVNLQTTTEGYFNFRAHFVTIPQLLFSRFWGYGGSTWGSEDGLSLALGLVQWISGLCVVAAVLRRFIKQKYESTHILALLLLCVSLFCLFLTHNKSAFVWEAFSDIAKYIQFPWRFLGVSLFLISLSAGYLPLFTKKYARLLSFLFVAAAIGLNVAYFKEDIWRNVTDQDMQTGEEWVEQTRASIGDYWPTYGPIPTDVFIPKNGLEQISKTSNSAEYHVFSTVTDTVSLPITYFPGWEATVNNQTVSMSYDTFGRILVPIQMGENDIRVILQSTKTQKIGNRISLVAVTMLIGYSLFIFFKKRK